AQHGPFADMPLMRAGELLDDRTVRRQVALHQRLGCLGGLLDSIAKRAQTYCLEIALVVKYPVTFSIERDLGGFFIQKTLHLRRARPADVALSYAKNLLVKLPRDRAA